MDYYSPIKKNETLPFATKWMDLGGIMWGEIRQRKTNTILFHLQVKHMEKQNKWTKEKQADSQVQRGD